jgi:hypothetical protein
MLQIDYYALAGIAVLEGDIAQAQQYFLKGLRISKECGQTREILTALVGFTQVYMAQGNLAQALQLIAVVQKHPASEQNTLNSREPLRAEAEKLRVQIEPQLAPALYQAAWAAGQQRQLAEVVAELLA